MSRILAAALSAVAVLSVALPVRSAQRQSGAHDEATIDTTPRPAARAAADEAPTQVTMRNVDFHVGKDVILRIHRLRGLMHQSLFTKLRMDDAEMLVVDADPRTPFDFDNPNYRKQLVAGHSRTLPDMGLEVWMPDARSLHDTP